MTNPRRVCENMSPPPTITYENSCIRVLSVVVTLTEAGDDQKETSKRTKCRPARTTVENTSQSPRYF